MKKINIVFIFAIILALGVAANAATFPVTNLVLDTVDNAPGDGTCADAGGFCTLRAAIGEANALAGADTITIPAGTITITLVAALEDANLGGDFDVTQSLTITGAGEGSTIIQAAVTSGTATERVFHNVTAGQTLTLQRMTVQNGRLTGTAGTNARGGGIRNDGIMVMNNVSVLNNSAAQVGGGIYNSGTSITLNRVTVNGNLCTFTTTCFGGGFASLAGAANVGASTFTGNTATATTAANSGVAAGFYGQDTNTTINNSTFSNNTGNGATTGGSNGTGLRFNTSAAVVMTVIIQNTTVSNNVGTLAAGNNHSGVGAAFNITATGTQNVTMTNVTFSGNTGSNSGAGFSISGAGGNITMTNCNVTGNTLTSAAVNNFGGGISLIGNSTLTANTSNISSNNSVTTNPTFSGFAGGIYNQGGTLVLNSSNVSSNTATFHGGIRALASGTNATTTLNSTTVNGNTAGEGGGVVNIPNTGLTSTTNINNSTISGNSVTGAGGGIEQFGTAGTGVTNINNSTIVNNTANSDNTGAADNGGGIFSSFGTINMKNTILGDNAVGTGSAGPDCSGTVTSADYNLIESSAGCTIAGTTTNNVTATPDIAALAFNGGFTRTHALNSQSFAINAGDPTNCQTIAAVAVTLDERGLPRSQGGARCDIGAFERGGFIWTGPPLAEGKTSSDDLGPGNAWNNPSNWQGGVVPGSGDYAIFNAGSSQSVTVTSSISVGGVIYGAGYTGTLTLDANLTIFGSLQMNAGNIIVNGSNNLVIGTSGTATRTSGVVIGNMQKQIGGFVPFTYPVGTTVRFLPVTITPSSPLNEVAMGTSSFTVKANPGFLPDTSATNSLFSYWTLTSSGVAQADITFVYPDDAVPNGANEALFQFVRRSGVTNTFFPPTTFNTTTNTFTLNGVTTFSDWGLGVPGVNAAQGTISGRVTNSAGTGIRNVTVMVTGGNLNQPLYTRTSDFGYYQLPELPVGDTYVVSVLAKRYTFSSPSQIVTLNDNVADLNFVADGTVSGALKEDGK